MKTENSKSCCGCKFLYGDGVGYSNYTWMETLVVCALDKNPLLNDKNEEPYNWTNNAVNDNWERTKDNRCNRYDVGKYIVLDPDREIILSEESEDNEQINAITKHQEIL